MIRKDILGNFLTITADRVSPNTLAGIPMISVCRTLIVGRISMPKFNNTGAGTRGKEGCPVG